MADKNASGAYELRDSSVEAEEIWNKFVRESQATSKKSREKSTYKSKRV